MIHFGFKKREKCKSPRLVSNSQRDFGYHSPWGGTMGWQLLAPSQMSQTTFMSISALFQVRKLCFRLLEVLNIALLVCVVILFSLTIQLTTVTNINATNSTIWTIHNAHTWVHLALCQTFMFGVTPTNHCFFLCKKNIYNICRIYRCRYFVSFNSFWENLTLNNNSRRKHTTQMYSLTSATITRWANLSVYVSLCPSIYHQHCFVQFFTFSIVTMIHSWRNEGG